MGGVFAVPVYGVAWVVQGGSRFTVIDATWADNLRVQDIGAGEILPGDRARDESDIFSVEAGDIRVDLLGHILLTQLGVYTYFIRQI